MKRMWIVLLVHEDGHGWAVFVKCRKRRVAMRMGMGAAFFDEQGRALKYRLVSVRRVRR